MLEMRMKSLVKEFAIKDTSISMRISYECDMIQYSISSQIFWEQRDLLAVTRQSTEVWAKSSFVAWLHAISNDKKFKMISRATVSV
jgi:hypothetical protein